MPDVSNFYQQYKAIEPYLKIAKKPEGGKEHFQSKEDRKLLVRACVWSRPRRQCLCCRRGSGAPQRQQNVPT